MEQTSKTRVLVIYGSNTGCSRTYADTVAKELGEKGFVTEVDDAAHNPLLDDFNAVVAIGSVHAMKWHTSLSSWMALRSAQLRNIPVGVGIICLSILNPNKRESALGLADSSLAEAGIQPVSKEVFPGWYLSSMLSLPDRVIMKMMGTPQGDHRDLTTAKKWADELADKFSQQVSLS